MTEQKRIFLSSPHLSGNELDRIKTIFEQNWIAPAGPDLDHFEKAITTFTKCGDAAALNSATAALHLALRLMDIGHGDLVFVQTHNHVGSVNPIIYQGATPVFIDSEPDTWNMDPDALEQAILAARSGEIITDPSPPHPLTPSLTNQQTSSPPKSAILPVHLYGMPANMDAIMAVAEKYDVPVIEDAAESLGSTYRGKQTGTFGKMGVYSFNGNKIITTSGGGALVSDDEELIQKARFLATQARDPAPHYQHSEIGYNYRLSNVLAGIGRGQMEVLPERIEQRRANHRRYRECFAKWNQQGFDIRFQEEPDGSFSNRWLTCILVDPDTNQGLTREKLRLALEEVNIEARPLWKPMHLQPVFKEYPFFGDGTAERLFEIGLCLPSGSNLTANDFERIFGVLDELFGSW